MAVDRQAKPSRTVQLDTGMAMTLSCSPARDPDASPPKPVPEAAATSQQRDSGKVSQRINGLPIQQHREEDVGAVGHAGAGDMTQRLTGSDVAPSLGNGRHEVAQVGVERHQPARVL